MRVPDEDSSIRVKRVTSSRLGILVRQLHFHSADEFIATIINVVSRKEWTKTDLESLERYGKIIEVMEGTAKTDLEMYQKVGIKGDIVKKFKDKSNRCIVFHHGHFIESIYMLMSNLSELFSQNGKNNNNEFYADCERPIN